MSRDTFAMDYIANQQRHFAERLLILFGMVLTCLCMETAVAQTGQHFDTVSVRIAPATEQGMRVMYDPNHFLMTNTTVLSLIDLAYNMEDYQIADVPAWVKSLHVDVEAKVDLAEIAVNKASTNEPTQQDLDQERLREELRNLLVDRFALKVNRDLEARPAYFLMLESNNRKKMIEATNAGQSVQTGPGHLKCSHSSMTDLADWLSQAVGRRVIDKTGRSGFYAFTLDWDPTEGMETGTGVERPPDIFTALKEQLGLRLASGEAPTPVIHISNISRPSPN